MFKGVHVRLNKTAIRAVFFFSQSSYNKIYLLFAGTLEVGQFEYKP